ncbi:MAG: 3-oxoacyl-[acyl-carrier-protein] synthase III C-terminal domain-containing protein [Gammaproteobacteria bacterium]|nr:3-oxoacyl-[acyl-carrier-protein] synthase III C-terminal domain-containing protein [Gammaproteobacteria bacterium]
MDVYLQDPVYALGTSRFSVAESVAASRTLSDERILREAGFESHHVCAPDDRVEDLAIRAARELDGRLDTVSVIVYSTCLPLNANVGSARAFEDSRDVKHLMDFAASRLQTACGLGDAQVIGLNQQACTGMLGSIRLARALLVSEPDVGEVLCITADRFPPNAIYEQAYNLISDGAAAVRISRAEQGFRVLTCHQITNGALVQASDDETVGTYFNYTHRLIEETLARVGLGIAEIDWIVAQNMNVKAWEILSRLLGVPRERVRSDSLAEVGHVISGDNVINLRQLDESGRIRAGDRVLMVMAGYGMNWQSVLLEKV